MSFLNSMKVYLLCLMCFPTMMMISLDALTSQDVQLLLQDQLHLLYNNDNLFSFSSSQRRLARLTQSKLPVSLLPLFTELLLFSHMLLSNQDEVASFIFLQLLVLF